MSSSKKTEWLVQPQGKLRVFGLIVMLIAVGLVTPMAMDMYLPAVPHMAGYFATSESMVNLTLVGYFLFFSIGLLVFGPISDRLGRKKVLLAGLVCYTAASVLCAFASSISLLITFRIIQAIGAGASNAIATAIVKDAIAPGKRELVLSIIQVANMIGPIVAPVIGAWIIIAADWHSIFWALAIIGVGCVAMALLYEETLPEEHRYEGSFISSMKLLGVVAKQRGFVWFLIIFALFNLPFMAYIAAGSYVYISFFGLSELEFSYFFAATSIISMAGPFIWLRISRYITRQQFTWIIILSCLAAGIAIVLFGALSPFTFFAFFAVFSLVSICTRPFCANILLSQVDEDAGAASSLIHFANTGVGCIGMALIILPWPNLIVGIGLIVTFSTITSLILWILFLRSSVPFKGIKDE